MNLSKQKAFSIIESLLFVSSEPRPLCDFETLFKGDLSSKEILEILKELKQAYLLEERGIHLEKVSKGWQLRTKAENKDYIKKMKPPVVFRLSKLSLEALAIIAFEQPCTKMRVDEIRGVDSAHLLRNLIEKELVCWAGQSDLPGKPSLYKTTKKFLETFGLENLKTLPSDKQLEELFATKEEEDKTLNSVSKEFDHSVQKQNLQNAKKDEKEGQNIKNLLKSFPLTVNFLEKETKKDSNHSVPFEKRKASLLTPKE
ncbi:MAG: SMC-Scp complex subunit ScpB [Bdellovibrionales bacterium]|nr:SMC-Scp complex subunit ScpB [Bdellovibrionales bacterium]